MRATAMSSNARRVPIRHPLCQRLSSRNRRRPFIDRTEALRPLLVTRGESEVENLGVRLRPPSARKPGVGNGVAIQREGNLERA